MPNPALLSLWMEKRHDCRVNPFKGTVIKCLLDCTACNRRVPETVLWRSWVPQTYSESVKHHSKCI